MITLRAGQCVCLAAAAAAFVAGLVLYPGNRFVFAGFSVVMFGLLGGALRTPRQYAHLFLALAWFTGFWFKYLYHLVTGAPYYELSGSFDNSPAAWDAVFTVIATGFSGYVAGRLVWSAAAGRLQIAAEARTMWCPSWWPARRNLMWLAAGALVLLVVLANQEFGLLTRGYVAKLILPWPLGGLFAWMTDIGLALLLAIFLVWDRLSGCGVARGFAALAAEGALFSVSTLSRGIYFFHTIPALVTEGGAALRASRRRQLALLLIIWIAAGVAVPSATTFLRLFGSQSLPTTDAQLANSRSVERRTETELSAGVLLSQFEVMARLLLIDRWTGLEGTMATVAYPAKSMGLFAEAALKRRSYGTVDVYTRRISGASFSEENAKIYHFATLAGPIAFLYFSGSLLLAFVGMAFLALLVSGFECAWRWLVGDRLLVAVSGLYLALVVLQLSGSVVQAVTGPLAVTAVFVLLRSLGSLVARSGPAPSSPTQVLS
ncbi:hypothetical protein ACQR1I_35730 [Bradyrhizobium sp. HKCCYLS2038]|uniref:hypothetical protein n=1 Tax=unclassified Bradyrhizobium TaxID=2631580 RepID=UPI003EC154A7